MTSTCRSTVVEEHASVCAAAAGREWNRPASHPIKPRRCGDDWTGREESWLSVRDGTGTGTSGSEGTRGRAGGPSLSRLSMSPASPETALAGAGGVTHTLEASTPASTISDRHARLTVDLVI